MRAGSGFAVLRNPLLVVAIIVLAIKWQSQSTPTILRYARHCYCSVCYSETNWGIPVFINIEDELAQKADEAREQ